MGMNRGHARDTMPPAESFDATDPGEPAMEVDESALAGDGMRSARRRGPREATTSPDAVDVERLILALDETPQPPHRLSSRRPEASPEIAMRSRAASGWVWMGGAVMVGLVVFASVVLLSHPNARSQETASTPPRPGAAVTPSPSAGTSGATSAPDPSGGATRGPPPPGAIPLPATGRPDSPRPAKRGPTASPAGSSPGASPKRPAFGDW
jgi:hypothetical protein